MISLIKINPENNRSLLKAQEECNERILDLVFVGIIEFEKGRRRNDPKGFYKGMGPEVAS